jgi:hypothetical protein
MNSNLFHSGSSRVRPHSTPAPRWPRRCFPNCRPEPRCAWRNRSLVAPPCVWAARRICSSSRPPRRISRRRCATVPRTACPALLLGRGSNLLFAMAGCAASSSAWQHADFSRLEVRGTRLHCGAGVKLKHIAHEARRYSLAGLEFLEGIPGSLGGGLRMNAGAMGGWMFEVVESVRCMDERGRHAGTCPRRDRSHLSLLSAAAHHVALGAVLRGSRATVP